MLAGLGLASALADGCFVFKWNKAVDINEPAQKAIIFHDSGREDLLLQVKYEGSLEDFGWLIPTPNLPDVGEGTMEPFYELSKLTQRHFGSDEGRGTGRNSLTQRGGGPVEDVKVIQIKTVGAYEVSILSTKDAGSLQRWLKAHAYSFPEGKSEILEEYIRLGWYFVAAKIELNKGLGFKKAPATTPKEAPSAAGVRTTLQSKLSSGELHPLLISFDTPKAVFPLRISAAGGKPSEVSLYLIAAEPLLSGFIYGQSVERLGRQCDQWEAEKSVRPENRSKSKESISALKLQFFLDSFYSKDSGDPIRERLRDYTREELIGLAREEESTVPTENLGEVFYAPLGEMLRCLRVNAKELPVCARSFSRLKKGEWYLTKQVHTFTPTEMRDIEFEPAFSALAGTMSQRAGETAARVLAQLGPKAQVYLTQACRSTNSTERLNAVIGIEGAPNPGFADALLVLLKDQTPAIRLHALCAVNLNPESRFVDTIVGLLRDPIREVRMEAGGYLTQHEPPERTPFYLALMRDPDPNVRMSSLGIASWINRYAPSDEVFREALRLLKDPNEDVRAGALHALYRMHDKDVPRAEILPFLSSPDSGVRGIAYAMLSPRSPGLPRVSMELSSTETVVLLTNRVTTVRLLGLKNLRGRGDADAVELIFPLLADTNKLVRNRAFFVLREITGADVPENDPAKWQAWWTANKSSFRPKPTVEQNEE
jgi:HEAT repeat protein